MISKKFVADDVQKIFHRDFIKLDVRFLKELGKVDRIEWRKHPRHRLLESIRSPVGPSLCPMSSLQSSSSCCLLLRNHSRQQGQHGQHLFRKQRHQKEYRLSMIGSNQCLQRVIRRRVVEQQQSGDHSRSQQSLERIPLPRHWLQRMSYIGKFLGQQCMGMQSRVQRSGIRDK